MDENGSETDEGLNSSVDGFEDDVPDLSSFESSPATGQKRKSELDIIDAKIKKRKGSKPKDAPLTADELIYLKETENLFQSNVFRLQISELLRETKPSKGLKRYFPLWLDDFNKYLDKLEDTKERELKKSVKYYKKQGINPPILVPDNVTGTFKFVKPVRALSTGCLVDGTTIGPPFSLEVVLVMPKSIFKKSDKFDQQYLVKRALYLSHIASLLEKSDLVSTESKIEFIARNGDALKPCLIFKCSRCKSLDVIISAVPETDTLKLTQFTPEKSNITSVSKEELPSTPHYNATVCEDLVFERNQILKKSVLESNQNIKDAAVLIGVWLRQRELCQGYGGFDMHIVTMYLIHMLKNRRLNTGMSCNQILRTFWLDISGKTDWTSNGPTLFEGSSEDQSPPKDVFHSNYEVVFIDVTGFHNITFRMRREIFIKVKKDAEYAIGLLNKSDSTCFQALFLRKAPLLYQYDNVIRFHNPDAASSVISLHADKKQVVDHCCHEVPIFAKLVTNLLQRGLDNRLDSICAYAPVEARWQLCEAPTSFRATEVLVGLKFNPSTALSVIDKGPPSNSPEGIEFRQFWGDKCQLRRFKDGSISESVIWAENTLPIRDRRLICQKIACHLMESKLGISQQDFTYVGLQLDFLTAINFAPHRSPEESCLAMHKVFTRLSQDLHELKLPLEIVSVHCISEAYRFTDPFPPMKSHFSIVQQICEPDQIGYKLKKNVDCLPPYTPVVDVVVQMSISGKWPEDLKACKRLVAAFYVEIASAFSSSKRYQTQVTPDFVIVRKDAFIFRISLGYSKQIAILKQRVNDLGVKQYRDSDESVAVEKKFINLPKLTGAMFGLSQLYSSFGATCVMAKRWVSSHMLHDTHFPSVLVELLVAHLFVSSQPAAMTMQPLPMFLRFLKTLSTTNFHVEPIIVNFNDALDRNAIGEIEKHFTTNRETLPPMFVATPFDTTGVLWTRKAPTLPVLVLLAKLAAASLNILEPSLCAGSVDEIMRIFKPPADIYHLMIRLDPRVVTRRHHRIDFNERLSARSPKMDSLIPVHDFDPVATFVHLLEENYRDQASFFYDKYGGQEIGVVLKPSFMAAAPFKVSSFEGKAPVESNGQIISKPDLVGLAEGFKVLGSGLVDEVTILLSRTGEKRETA